MTLLDARELTAEERAAVADEPRPGVWIDAKNWANDGRVLSQEDTDVAIVTELWASTAGNARAHEALRDAVHPWLDDSTYTQRGGIHSDPLVRLLAYRAWGERDRRWTKRDTARTIASGDTTDVERWRSVYGFDGFVIYNQASQRRQAFEATRSSRRSVVERSYAELAVADQARSEMFLDVFDELDAKLEAGGDRLPDGPTIDLP